MKKFFLFALIFMNYAFSDQFFGGHSLFNTQTARTLGMGYIQISSSGRIYRKADGWENGVQLVNATGLLGCDFGYNNNLDIGLYVTFYQDINKDASEESNVQDVNSPDAFYLRAKYLLGTFDLGTNMLGKLAMTSACRFVPNSKEVNMILEPYYQDNVSFHINAIFSLYFDQLYANDSQSLHFDFGYINHNDAPNYELMKGMGNSAMEITYGIGYKYPTTFLDYNCELSGRMMFNLSDEMLKNNFSTEPYTYLTPSIKYKPFAGLNFDIGCDILLYTPYDNYTEAENSVINRDSFPYYSGWRLLLRANYTPSSPYVDIPSFTSSASVKNRMQNISNRKELFEWLIEDPDRVEYIDVKLEKLRSKRKSLEKDIEDLKSDVEK